MIEFLPINYGFYMKDTFKISAQIFDDFEKFCKSHHIEPIDTIEILMKLFINGQLYIKKIEDKKT